MRVPSRFIGLLLGLTVSSIAIPASAQDAAKVLERANKAMGIDGLKTLRYTAEGTGQTFGQAYDTQSPWPKITVHSQVRTIDYASGSMREEFTLSRAEPKGGGGYPITGQQRNDTFVSGNYAWNVAGTNAVPMSRSVLDRTHQMWVTPHGALIAAARNKATVSYRKVGEKSLPSLSFVEPLRFRAVIHLDAEHQVERIESRLPDPVLGETTAVTRFSGYQSHGALRFPGRIQQSQGGHPILDVTVKEVVVNGPTELAIPEAVRNATERVTTDKVADGVWFIGGGSHNSVAIEMKDHLVLVESPLFDGRALPVIEKVKALAPGKPIRYLINSHNHFDHAGGVRTAIASGATIVTHASNKAFFEKTALAQSKIAPDELAKSGRKARFLTVNEKHVMKDSTRSIEIFRIADSNHAHNFLMIYLPADKLLIEADAFTPGAPGAAPPATPNPNNLNLVDNIERLKLDVDRILPLHGRVVPVADLYAATGRKPAR